MTQLRDEDQAIVDRAEKSLAAGYFYTDAWMVRDLIAAFYAAAEREATLKNDLEDASIAAKGAFRVRDAAESELSASKEREAHWKACAEENENLYRGALVDLATLRATIAEPTEEMVAATQAFIKSNRGVGFDEHEFSRRALIAGNGKVLGL